jgi:hypothetical protein
MPAPSTLFNAYQLRRVRIILQNFEEDLLFAQLWLDQGMQEGSLVRMRMELQTELRVEALRKIKQGLEEIRRLAEMLDLEPQTENVARRVMGSMNIDWENLNEMQSNGLKGFGEVAPEIASFLDEPAERMAKIALSLSNIFMKAPARLDADTQPSHDKENT